jgi:hypothetical protein
MPIKVMIALVNARTRKAVRDKRLELDAKVYATDAARER